TAQRPGAGAGLAAHPLHPPAAVPAGQRVCPASAGKPACPTEGGAGGSDSPPLLLSADITIKVEDPDCLSSSSYRDVETERFLSSSSSTARRVSFNEAALYDQGKKTQEKGRRYTLTEGDFHHLKNARLTHLHLPPPALKIVTIHECESSENSLAMTPRLPPPKPGLAIFQPPAGALPQPALPSHAVCPSSALPGDTYNSTVDTSFAEASPSASSDSGEGPSVSAGWGPGAGAGRGRGSAGSAPSCSPQSDSTGMAPCLEALLGPPALCF
uniref:Uncharacterized protein n=1 Tax=Anser brachyrhynchus TaxID=132585 RepID=A0A8B9CL91_9AVES